MDDLRGLYEGLGFTRVTTYVQSGNVVFASAASEEESALGERIEAAIAVTLGVSVRVIVRSSDELQRIVDNNPFLKRGEDPASLHVTFLAGAPERAGLDEVPSPNADEDEFALAGREAFIVCRHGYGRTKLNTALRGARRRSVGATPGGNRHRPSTPPAVHALP